MLVVGDIMSTDLNSCSYIIELTFATSKEHCSEIKSDIQMEYIPALTTTNSNDHVAFALQSQYQSHLPNFDRIP